MVEVKCHITFIVFQLYKNETSTLHTAIGFTYSTKSKPNKPSQIY